MIYLTISISTVNKSCLLAFVLSLSAMAVDRTTHRRHQIQQQDWVALMSKPIALF